ncbi:RagB/SusD family nutrient uptake outer membrane protein [Parapedobacter sp. DT-150]|uniref:RagB/SusD family nutrient uptake outer membrane protein n=1 Tax=Parapedobacter sp. DT-150 TaxID=3396162 RepID=UPI003F1B1109
MKKLTYTLYITLLSIGCSNELDLRPTTSLTEGDFYQTEEQFRQAANDVYRQLRRTYEAKGVADQYGELASDNTFIQIAAGTELVSDDISNFRITSNNARIQSIWETSYNGIFICNHVIEQLEATEVVFSDPTLKERLKAEALFVRSLIYFNMVRAWGNIPLVLKVLSQEESYEYLREDKATVYAQLVSDLTYCKETLPESYTGSDVGRVTRYAARAVLAKVFLTIGEADNARAELEAIIGSGKYSLDANGNGVIDTSDYLHVFHPATKNCKESILEIQYLAGQNQVNSTHQMTYLPWHFAFHLPGQTEVFRPLGLNTPTDDLMNEFETADAVRKRISAQPGFDNPATGQFVDYPFTMKFYDPDWRYPGQNVEIIRYADILLMYAEVTGDPIYLNAVRARAGLPGFGEPGYPSAYPTLALAIEHERRMELCFEFHRFFDLVRTNRAIAVMGSKGYAIDETKLLFPIPLNVIDVNPAITQNPGY